MKILANRRKMTEDNIRRGSLRRLFVWPSKNRRSETSEREKQMKKKTKEKTRKAPGALDPATVLPPPWDAKYITVTEGTSPNGVNF